MARPGTRPSARTSGTAEAAELGQGASLPLRQLDQLGQRLAIALLRQQLPQLARTRVIAQQAGRLGLQVQTATVGVEPAPGASGALGSKRFLEALFSPESLEKKRNTEAVEVGSNQLAAGRVVKHSPAHTQDLAEIKDKVRQMAIQEKAAALAKAGVNVRLIDQGASELSIIVGVDEADCETALGAIYHAFVTEK